MEKSPPAKRTVSPKYFKVYENSVVISQMWDTRVIFVTSPNDQVCQCIFQLESEAKFFRSILEAVFAPGSIGLTLAEGPSLQEFLEKLKNDLNFKSVAIVNYVTEKVTPRETWETTEVFENQLSGDRLYVQTNRYTGAVRVSIGKMWNSSEFTQVSEELWQSLQENAIFPLRGNDARVIKEAKIILGL